MNHHGESYKIKKLRVGGGSRPRIFHYYRLCNHKQTLKTIFNRWMKPQTKFPRRFVTLSLPLKYISHPETEIFGSNFNFWHISSGSTKCWSSLQSITSWIGQAKDRTNTEQGEPTRWDVYHCDVRSIFNIYSNIHEFRILLTHVYLNVHHWLKLL